VILKKKYLKLLFVTVIFCSCNRKLINQIKQEENLSSFASITADSIFYSEISQSPYWTEKPHIQFLYNSLFGLDQNSVYLQKGEECKFFITQPTLIWGQQINEPVILYPKEKIDMQIAEFGNVQFVSGDVKRTKELECFNDLAKTLEEELPRSISLIQSHLAQNADSIIKYDSIIRLQLNKQRELISIKVDSLTKANEISATFKLEMINYLWARIFALKVEYFWLTKKYFKPGKILESRYAELVSCSNAIQSHGELKHYYRSLDGLMRFLSASRNGVSSIYDTASFYSVLHTVKDNFHGLVKDFLIADILYSGLRNKVISSYHVKKYSDEECNDKTYRLVLKEIARTSKVSEKYASAEEGKFILPFGSKNPISDDKLLDSYKGKLVIVDFWASWCIPCRRELPLMRELKRQYFGKDIVFLTISIDKTRLEWQKANGVEKLSAEESFVMNSSDSGFYFKGHRIEAIPRYLLFNKDGSVIDDNAPSPGTNALKEMIDKYLYQ
jgi:thiol-disulfide isomerase/thioredoxin